MTRHLLSHTSLIHTAERSAVWYTVRHALAHVGLGVAVALVLVLMVAGWWGHRSRKMRPARVRARKR